MEHSFTVAELISGKIKMTSILPKNYMSFPYFTNFYLFLVKATKTAIN